MNIRGKTSGIALRGAYDDSGNTKNPLYKDANIWGYANRIGYQQKAYTLMFEHGYASGDDNPADKTFTARALHPDFNVGLILFEQVMARVTAATWSEQAFALWSNGGVWNSRYIFPNVRYRPGANWEIIGAYLLAWPDKPDGSRILPGRTMACSVSSRWTAAQEIGYEVDLAVKHRFHEHVLLSVEGGHAKVSNRVPLANVGLNPDGRFMTFQTRVPSSSESFPDRGGITCALNWPSNCTFWSSFWTSCSPGSRRPRAMAATSSPTCSPSPSRRCSAHWCLLPTGAGT